MLIAQILRSGVRRAFCSVKSSKRWGLIVVIGLCALMGCGAAVDYRAIHAGGTHGGAHGGGRAELVSEQRGLALKQVATFSRLPAAQQRALISGHLVALPMVQTVGDRRYSGGVAYLLVHASAASVMRALSDTQGMERVLPRTKRATVLSEGAGWRQVELLQGNNWVEATYTVTLQEQPESANDATQRVTFALDHTRPHDIDDLKGYFSVEPLYPNQCVVSVAAFVDLGSSLAALFERHIQDLILSTPLNVRRHIEQTPLASAN